MSDKTSASSIPIRHNTDVRSMVTSKSVVTKNERPGGRGEGGGGLKSGALLGEGCSQWSILKETFQ